jgi:hypothetical protein
MLRAPQRHQSTFRPSITIDFAIVAIAHTSALTRIACSLRGIACNRRASRKKSFCYPLIVSFVFELLHLLRRVALPAARRGSAQRDDNPSPQPPQSHRVDPLSSQPFQQTQLTLLKLPFYVHTIEPKTGYQCVVLWERSTIQSSRQKMRQRRDYVS